MVGQDLAAALAELVEMALAVAAGEEMGQAPMKEEKPTEPQATGGRRDGEGAAWIDSGCGSQ